MILDPALWNRVSRQVASGAQVELCLLCLPPGFPAVPHHLNHTPVGPGPSQNRAGAIYAHGSSHGHSRSSEHPDLDPRLRKRKPLQYFAELFPVETSPLSAAIEPLEQELFRFRGKSLDPGRVVRYAIIGVVASQFGLGCRP